LLRRAFLVVLEVTAGPTAGTDGSIDTHLRMKSRPTRLHGQERLYAKRFTGKQEGRKAGGPEGRRAEGWRVKTCSLLNFHPSENRCTSVTIGSRRCGEPGGHHTAAEITRPQCLSRPTLGSLTANPLLVSFWKMYQLKKYHS
jgi:hypothetical protein